MDGYNNMGAIISGVLESTVSYKWQGNLSLDEVKEYSTSDCFFADLHYEWVKLQDQNTYKRLFMISRLMLYFGIICVILDWKNFINLPAWQITVYTCMWVLVYCMISIRQYITGREIQTKLSDTKYNICMMHFKRLEGYDKMEEWIRDKVLRDEILPLVGIQTPENEDNESN